MNPIMAVCYASARYIGPNTTSPVCPFASDPSCKVVILVTGPLCEFRERWVCIT